MNLSSEINHFKSFPRNMRYLLFAGLLYAFVLPVIELFVGAYIVSPPDPTTAMTAIEKHEKINLYLYYQFALYTGIPVCFIINGFVIKKFAGDAHSRHWIIMKLMMFN